MDNKEDLSNSPTEDKDTDVEDVHTGDEKIPDKASSLQDQLSEAYSKNESLHTKYLRTFADLENLKKDLSEIVKKQSSVPACKLLRIYYP